ncbi:class I SAM-dependent methyltransferase [Niabella terrae]
MKESHKFEMFRNRLTKVYRHLQKVAKKQHISCYRIYNHDLSEFPFIIEIYADKLYVAEYKKKHQLSVESHQYWLKESLAIMSEVLAIPVANIYLKQRQRKPGHEGQYQKTAEEKNEFTINENDLNFIVNLSDYLDTGLFLDHRTTRQMIRQQSEAKRVLNLFAYTGSFSVYAGAGRAASVTTVDLSNTYINWARRNMALNGFEDPERYHFITTDVLQYLNQATLPEFDLIILDPPTFSNSKKMNGVLDVQQDHVQLINQCLRLLHPGGSIYFSNNYTRFRLDAEQLNAGAIKDITRATTPFDFEGKLQRWCYLITK